MKKLLIIVLCVLLAAGASLAILQGADLFIALNERVEILEGQQVELLIQVENQEYVLTKKDEELMNLQVEVINYMNSNLVTVEYAEQLYNIFDLRTQDLRQWIEELQQE